MKKKRNQLSKKRKSKRNSKRKKRKNTKRRTRITKRRSRKNMRGGFYKLYVCGHPDEERKEEIIINEDEELYDYMRDETFQIQDLKRWLGEKFNVPPDSIKLYKDHKCSGKVGKKNNPEEYLPLSEDLDGNLYVEMDEQPTGMDEQPTAIHGAVDETNLGSVSLSDKSTGSFIASVDGGSLSDQAFTDREIELLRGQLDPIRFEYLNLVIPSYLRVGYTIPTALLGLYNSGRVLEEELEKMYKFLININSDIDFNETDKNGEAPIDFAISFVDNINIINYLIDEIGIDVNKPNGDGNAPLSTAITWEKIEIVDILIRAGADVNKPNGNGDTPLSNASVFGNLRMVDILIRAGADVNKPNRAGRTPLKIALDRGNSNIVESLKQAGASLGKRNITFKIDWKKYRHGNILVRGLLVIEDVPLREEMTIKGLKDIIKVRAESKGVNLDDEGDVKRLIYAGKILKDHELVEEVFDFDDDDDDDGIYVKLDNKD